MAKLGLRPSKLQGLFLKGLKKVLGMGKLLSALLKDLALYPGLGILRWVAKKIDRVIFLVGSYQESIAARRRRFDTTKTLTKKAIRGK